MIPGVFFLTVLWFKRIERFMPKIMPDVVNAIAMVTAYSRHVTIMA